MIYILIAYLYDAGTFVKVALRPNLGAMSRRSSPSNRRVRRRAKRPNASEETGAHVSIAGGVYNAPGRAEEIGAPVFQIFTKQPSRWAEPIISEEDAARFKEERERTGAWSVGSHDSYLINLASPDDALWERSLDCFIGELRRGQLLGLDWVVTHPGNATDGDKERGIEANAVAFTRALETVDPSPLVLLELTAGAGTSVGGTFDELAEIIGRDLVDDYEGVWAKADETVGLERIRIFHVNDAKADLGSHLDRHDDIGKGNRKL